MNRNCALGFHRDPNVGFEWIYPCWWLPQVHTQTWTSQDCQENRCSCVHQRHRQNSTLRRRGILEVCGDTCDMWCLSYFKSLWICTEQYPWQTSESFVTHSYDEAAGTMDKDYPRSIETDFPGMDDEVDAAAYHYGIAKHQISHFHVYRIMFFLPDILQYQIF